MKPTGKINKFTGEEILQAEESDLDLSKDWEELSINQKADFLSYLNFPFLNKEVEPTIKRKWEDLQKHRGYKD